jgi:hypothetical protein
VPSAYRRRKKITIENDEAFTSPLFQLMEDNRTEWWNISGGLDEIDN